MRTIITSAFIIIFNTCNAQNIINYFGIQEIKEIEISFAPHMDHINKDNKVVKITSDSIFLDEVYSLLKRLPDTGQIYKDFPSTIPTWNIIITDQNDKNHKLTYYGIKLRVPNSSKGTFYGGIKNKINLEKELYLVIRTFMLGNWYNCK